MLHRDTCSAEILQTSKRIDTEVGRCVQVNMTWNRIQHAHTYQAYSSSCNLERLAAQWYAVSHGIRNFVHTHTHTHTHIHESVHRESNLITAQQDAIYSVYYISVGSSTCFGC